METESWHKLILWAVGRTLLRGLALAPVTFALMISLHYAHRYSQMSILFDNPVMIGRNCAVVTNDSPYDLWIHCGCGVSDTCSSLSSLCATGFSENYSQFTATGIVNGTTSFDAIYLA